MKKSHNILFFLSLVSTKMYASNDVLDPLYQSGKIYVVVLILSIIFIGLGVFLLRLDKRISKLEKDE